MTTNFDLACALEAANRAHFGAVTALRRVAPGLGTEDELTDRCVTCHGHVAWFIEGAVVRWGDATTDDARDWYDETLDPREANPVRRSGGLVAVVVFGGLELFDAAREVPPRAIRFHDGTTTWSVLHST